MIELQIREGLRVVALFQWDSWTLGVTYRSPEGYAPRDIIFHFGPFHIHFLHMPS
tara:strand:- start:10686 stop:10850 length:165 start_codon:yes stop_codon:yes gene_type:complete